MDIKNLKYSDNIYWNGQLGWLNDLKPFECPYWDERKCGGRDHFITWMTGYIDAQNGINRIEKQEEINEFLKQFKSYFEEVELINFLIQSKYGFPDRLVNFTVENPYWRAKYGAGPFEVISKQITPMPFTHDKFGNISWEYGKWTRIKLNKDRCDAFIEYNIYTVLFHSKWLKMV